MVFDFSMIGLEVGNLGSSLVFVIYWYYNFGKGTWFFEFYFYYYKNEDYMLILLYLVGEGVVFVVITCV